MVKREDELRKYITNLANPYGDEVSVLDGKYVTPLDVVELVSKAFEAGWDARYKTLTWNDL